MISILTHSHNPLTKEFWKWAARKIKAKYSGPDAVLDSVVRGLKELQIPFATNPMTRSNDTVVTISGVVALKEAIGLKKQGRIKKLIAGPNVVTHPLESGGIICDESIDKVLVPSQWVADFWASEAPKLKDKLFVWPAGVASSTASTRSGTPIIYDKLSDSLLLAEIREQLNHQAKVFTYGTFDRKDYLAALAEAPFLIYLSQSESQGLALQEAWAHDVPTLVNKSTTWSNGRWQWTAAQINCPYLTSETGVVFEYAVELPTLTRDIVNLRPKVYCDNNLSDRVCAEKLLDIL